MDEQSFPASMIQDIPIISGYNSKNSIELIRKEAAKTLINKEINSNVLVVVVNTKEVTKYRDRLAEMKALKNAENNDSSKKLDLKIANTEEKLQKKIDVGDNLAPKKRVQKHRIDLDIEKLQQFKKDNQANKNSQLPKVFEPPVKRTRRSKPYRCSKCNSTSEEDISFSKKDFKKAAYQVCSTKTAKELLGCIKYLSKEDALIIRRLVGLRGIKNYLLLLINRQINRGQIQTLDQLEMNLMKTVIIYTLVPKILTGTKLRRKFKKIISNFNGSNKFDTAEKLLTLINNNLYEEIEVIVYEI